MLSSMKTGLRDAVNKLLHVSVIDNDIIKEFVKESCQYSGDAVRDWDKSRTT